MQNHPGFRFYPSLHDDGHVRFHSVDPASDSDTSHLSRYITASYLLIHELPRELNRARSALAAARSYPTPPSMGFTPYIVPSSSSPISPVTPPSSSGTSTVNPHSAPAEWASLLATPAAPMIPSHPVPIPEVSVSVVSSGSRSDSAEDPATPTES